MEISDIVNKVKSYGFCVIENFWSKEKCEKAITELSSVDIRNYETGQGGDLRFQNANHKVSTAKDFLEDCFIQKVATEYSSCSWAQRVVAGIVRYSDGRAIDSGGGWHVDSKTDTQFKSFMYLTDVGTDNGPFVFIRKSKSLAEDLPMYSNNRISQKTIDEIFDPNDIIEITGKAGTCILADSTYVHRGKQIQSGSRYAYTTYFYEKD